ncbi:hypothetical protein [Maridesulfovibrio ferrireducens]|uniref:hypothetical protein n=1 Tax=Maridesulfovibrio ferrireducens TaxID=246191 RepID=UPI0034E935F6
MLRLCSNQVRVGFGGVYGFDLPAIFAVADRMEIELGWREMLKIKAVESAMTERSSTDKDAE